MNDEDLVIEDFSLRYGKTVALDAVIDGGTGGMEPSTIVDCTAEPYSVLRHGLGEWME